MNPATRLALERTPRAAAGDVTPDERTQRGDDAGRLLVCVRCARAITTTAARVERGGKHAHTFANPHGFLFRIGCFATAPGCVTTSEPSVVFSWFPGHAWQVVACRGCGEHLGWVFSGGSRFHGLILDRLAETEGPGD